MTWANDLILEHYYVPPGHSKAYKLVGKKNFGTDTGCSNDLFLIFEDPVSKKKVTMVVNGSEQFDSECCGCVVQGGKKTRRKMKKRKPRKSRKARKSARC